MCDHRFDDDPNGSPCTRKDAHEEKKWGGHTYESTSARDAEPADGGHG